MFHRWMLFLLVMGKLETNRDVSASKQRETEEDDDSVWQREWEQWSKTIYVSRPPATSPHPLSVSSITTKQMMWDWGFGSLHCSLKDQKAGFKIPAWRWYKLLIFLIWNSAANKFKSVLEILNFILWQNSCFIFDKIRICLCWELFLLYFKLKCHFMQKYSF